MRVAEALMVGEVMGREIVRLRLPRVGERQEVHWRVSLSTGREGSDFLCVSGKNAALHLVDESCAPYSSAVDSGTLSSPNSRSLSDQLPQDICASP